MSLRYHHYYSFFQLFIYIYVFFFLQIVQDFILRLWSWSDSCLIHTAYIYIHTYCTHILNTHTRTHTQTHARTCSHWPTHMHARTFTCPHTTARTHTHTQTHIHAHSLCSEHAVGCSKPLQNTKWAAQCMACDAQRSWDWNCLFFFPFVFSFFLSFYGHAFHVGWKKRRASRFCV